METLAPARGSILKAGLMGGTLAAVLHATPYVSNLNACCCALVIGAGLFSAWILQTDSGRTAGSGSCAAAGGLAGLLGGAVGVPLAALVSRVASGSGVLEERVALTMSQVRQMMEGWGVAPGSEEIAESVVRATLGLEFSGWSIFILIVTAIVFAFFGMLGGLLGGVLMRPVAAAGRLKPPPPPPPLRGGAVMPGAEQPSPIATGPADGRSALAEDDSEGPLAPDELPLLAWPTPPETAAGPTSDVHGESGEAPPGTDDEDRSR